MYLIWRAGDRRRRGKWNAFASQTASLQLNIFIGVLLGRGIFKAKTHLFNVTSYTIARSFQSTDKHSFHITHVCFARRFLLQMCRELLQVAVCVTQLIFHHDKTFAQLKLKATPAYTKWGSFPKPVSFFLSICLCLSPALSIHPPDVTCTQIKRDVQFPVPSCSGKRQRKKRKTTDQCAVFHIACWRERHTNLHNVFLRAIS